MRAFHDAEQVMPHRSHAMYPNKERHILLPFQHIPIVNNLTKTWAANHQKIVQYIPPDDFGADKK